MAEFEELLDYFDRQSGPKPKEHLGLAPSLTEHAANLSRVRWGIVVPPAPLTTEEQAHLHALTDLIARRETQQKKPVKRLEYVPNDTPSSFLNRYDVDPGAMEVALVPYYLLLVGSPERIPWAFQVLLDAEYAVGRFWFEDVEDAKRYVERLIATEEHAATPPQNLDTLFLAPRNPEDPATVSSHDNLTVPLLDRLTSPPTLTRALDTDATRSRVDTWLTGRSTPGLFFGACHGKESDEVGSLMLQGTDSLASTDLPADLDLQGALFFVFACFSAGIPGAADLLPAEAQALKLPPALALLPQKLLAAGATAYIGHVNRAWDYSFLGSSRAKPQVGPFAEVWLQLAGGVPVGHALDYMNTRALLYLNSLNALRSRASTLTPEEKKQFTEELWTWHDARYYVIVGDPAARLNLFT
ncbi:MAG: C25 family cysteine peptidase [Armatimonas sp.]